MVNMKDSGIEWIGTCPAHWQFLRGKYIFLLRNEKGNVKELQLLSPTQKFGVIPQSLFEELTTNTAVKVKESTDLSQFKTIHKGDFCISLRSFQGGFEYCLYEGVVSPAYQVFYPILKICDNYYKYLFKEQSFISKMNSYTLSLRDGKNIAFADFANTYLPIPLLSEQEKISSFLDEKCLEIENLVVDIQTEIDMLEEYKHSIITEKVTKGLNSDVEMKDSGIEWVGTIPAAWTIHPVYYYFGERKVKNYDLKEKNLLSLSYGKIIRKDINTNGGLLPANFSSYNIVEAGDIIIRPTDLQNDKRSLRTGLVTEHGMITSAYIDLVPKAGVNSKYFYYLLHAYDLMKVFYNMGNGVRQGLNYNEFSKLMVVTPMEEEQQKIVDYLDVKCAEIDSIIEIEKEQLIVLDEYKKTIIYEYVTGKKEVI